MTSKKVIADKILAKIPDHFNPVDFLHDALHISKESVYRRIKGDIAFTFEEITILSSKLLFSLDEFVFSNKQDEFAQQPISFLFRSNKAMNPQKTFVETLTAFIESKERIKEAKEVEVIVSSNRLMILTSAYFEHLFKFYYYKWIQQTEQMPLNFSFSDVEFSDEILSLNAQLKTYAPVGKDIYILDYNFLKNTLKEVQYYYNRMLISEEEMKLLQKDLYSFIDIMESRAKCNQPINGYQNDIYLSAFPIDSTGLYCKTDNKETLDLWISFGTSIRTENPAICDIYRSWSNSLKKYSSLITGCNEVLQSRFFEQQRKHIESITNKDYTL